MHHQKQTTKILLYASIAIAGLLVITIFLTAKTYLQLAIGIVLYPLIAYLALKVFPSRKKPMITIDLPKNPPNKTEIEKADKTVKQVDIVDIDKRTFLKLIGAAGISFFLFSLLGRRVDSLLFNKNTNQAANQTETVGSQGGAPQLADGYRITEVEDGVVSYYGFTNQSGAWLIMKQDTQTSSFRYANGNSGFSANWKNRENLKYDYYYKLF